MKRVILSEEFIRDVSIELEDSVHYCEKCGAADPVSGFDVSAMWREHFASPNAGKVTEAELEKAFTKFHDAQHIDGLSEDEAFRAALSAIGLEVE